MRNPEVKYVEGSEDQYDLKIFGEGEDPDGKTVDVVESKSRITLKTAITQFEWAKTELEKVTYILTIMQAAVDARAAVVAEEERVAAEEEE